MTVRAASTIRPAGDADFRDLVHVLASAFHRGDLASYLIPDEEERARRYPGYFTILAGQALAEGHVDLLTIPGTQEVAAGAVWYSLEEGETLPAVAQYQQRLAHAVGPALPRFTALDEAMERHHPHDREHHYLAFLAVLPHCQGRGYGSWLLDHRHRQLDAAGRPAYIEATGPRNRKLYRRHGYAARGAIPVSGRGHVLIPMWRDPRPAA